MMIIYNKEPILGHSQDAKHYQVSLKIKDVNNFMKMLIPKLKAFVEVNRCFLKDNKQSLIKMK